MAVNEMRIGKTEKRNWKIEIGNWKIETQNWQMGAGRAQASMTARKLEKFRVPHSAFIAPLC